jgi:hypothetical protein
MSFILIGGYFSFDLFYFSLGCPLRVGVACFWWGFSGVFIDGGLLLGAIRLVWM